MGYHSELQIEQQAKHESALDILVAAGTLARCPYHEECSFIDSDDVEAAYRRANFEYSRGEHQQFATRREMTDAIKAVFDEHGVFECQYCAKESR